jgi:serine/threonine protein kinase
MPMDRTLPRNRIPRDTEDGDTNLGDTHMADTQFADPPTSPNVRLPEVITTKVPKTELTYGGPTPTDETAISADRTSETAISTGEQTALATGDSTGITGRTRPAPDDDVDEGDLDAAPLDAATLDAATHLMSDGDMARVLSKLRPSSPGLPPVHPNLVIASQQRTRDATETNKVIALPPSAPRTLGTYKITGVIASGAMGIVYRGEHPNRRRPVAIKAVHGEHQRDPAIIARFFGESQATARVIHPNVVRFFDFGYDASGAAYLVMELLQGETLRQRLARERRLGIAVSVDIAHQIAQGLTAAHGQNVVHRDLKPDNVFLCGDPDDPENVIVKLIDFGLAKVQGEGPTQTMQGDLLGTPAYMAPEQGRSASESDARSDLYSLGCILFEMVCGVVPYPGNVVETLLAHQTAERPPARALNPLVPPALDSIIDRLLQREPSMRPQTASEVLNTLRGIESTFGAALRTGSVRKGTMVVQSTGLLQRLTLLPAQTIALIIVTTIAVVLAVLLVVTR